MFCPFLIPTKSIENLLLTTNDNFGNFRFMFGIEGSKSCKEVILIETMLDITNGVHQHFIALAHY